MKKIDFKPLSLLLKSECEYTYEEVLYIYDEAGEDACAEDNRKIAEKNAIIKSEVDERNRKNGLLGSSKYKENNTGKIITAFGISFIVSAIVGILSGEESAFIITFITIFIILVFMLGLNSYPDAVDTKKIETFTKIPSKYYTFYLLVLFNVLVVAQRQK